MVHARGGAPKVRSFRGLIERPAKTFWLMVQVWTRVMAGETGTPPGAAIDCAYPIGTGGAPSRGSLGTAELANSVTDLAVDRIRELVHALPFEPVRGRLRRWQMLARP